MNPITLSYILTTRNKLPYLQAVLPQLIANKKSDEEILVLDAGSSDGSAEYLAQLLAEKKIEYFVSEPDAGEAHGDNKGIWAARGALIKFITDDDAFHYPSLERCREFMLAHPEVDFLSGEGVKMRKDEVPAPMSSIADYKQWLTDHTPFTFCGLGVMLRRSSVPLVGLFDTNYLRLDAELALRVTYNKKVQVAWYTGVLYAHIVNEKSNSARQKKRMIEEIEKLEMLYSSKDLSWKQGFRRLRRKIKEALKPNTYEIIKQKEGELTFDDWHKSFTESAEWLEKNAEAQPSEFLWRK